ncbi:MAG: hypothetical protein AAF492_00900 [Verrucomicrobiota bacterium]
MIPKLLRKTGLSLLAIVLVLLLLEGAFRLFRATRHVTPERTEVQLDDTFGWVHNLHFKGRTRQNACGEDAVRLPYRHALINRFPTHPSGRRILFLGDSYTKPFLVSSGEGYYDVFERETGTNFAVYAIGHTGYGNVQEALAFEATVNDIQPEIVVWQLTGNDVRDNVFAFDNNSFINGQQKPRPYYELKRGRIQTRDPGFWLFDHSLVFRYLFRRLWALDNAKRWGLMRRIDRLNDFPDARVAALEQDGVEVLGRLLGRLIANHPDVEFYGFAVDQPFDEAFEAVFEQHGAGYFPRFYQAVHTAGDTDCAPRDLHWNHHGHDVAGRRLVELLHSNPR